MFSPVYFLFLSLDLSQPLSLSLFAPNQLKQKKLKNQNPGRPWLPPYWSLGLMQSKYGYQSIEECEEAVDGYREAKIPLETFVSDSQYMVSFLFSFFLFQTLSKQEKKKLTFFSLFFSTFNRTRTRTSRWASASRSPR